jgi:F-type H+-transporting ATPase subunit gamma
MSSRQDIQRRIKSVRNTRKVTKAMELVSGARLRRAQQRIEAMRPYAEGMERLISDVAGKAQGLRQPLLERRDVQTTAILAVTGDRGLAGAFNANIVRRSLELGREEAAEGRAVTYYAVGKRGISSLRFRRANVAEGWTGIADQPGIDDASAIAHHLANAYLEGEVDHVIMIYNRFRSALVQEVTVQELLPFAIEEDEDRADTTDSPQGLLLFEPPAEVILQRLLPDALQTLVLRALLESAASGHGARMTAMRSASDNAQDLIGSYTLAMNRARQAEITQEILEVVSGADALG